MADCYCNTCDMVWPSDHVVVVEHTDNEPYGDTTVERKHLEAFCPRCRDEVEEV